MLQRVVHGNGVVTYQSPLLAAVGVVHAFATRIGGVSTGPFTTLNLGNPAAPGPQDTADNLAENYRRLQDAIGAAGVQRCWVRQVHGAAVGVVAPESEGEYAEALNAEILDRWQGQTAADALLTAQPGVLLTVRIADCVPVLLASADGRVVAAVHAGWRGVVGGVVLQALKALGERGVEPDQVRAALGPAISAVNFEVGADVAQEFQRAGLAHAVQATGGGKAHVDMQGAVRAQLAAAGVAAIDGNGCCTVRDAADFFSHRRDQGLTGRMAAVIMCR